MQKGRVLILIDGGNFYHSSKKILKENEEINYQKLIDLLVGDRELVGVNYYVASLDIKIDPKRYWKHQRFLDNLKKIPKFNVVLCPLRKLKIDGGYRFIIKGDDARLIHDLIVGAYENIYDTVSIVSGDEDFSSMIKTVQRKDKKVENAYFKSSSSHILRRVCNNSINLNKNISKITNKK